MGKLIIYCMVKQQLKMCSKRYLGRHLEWDVKVFLNKLETTLHFANDKKLAHLECHASVLLSKSLSSLTNAL